MMLMQLCFYHDNDLDLRRVKLHPYGSKGLSEFEHEAEPNCPICRKKFPKLKEQFPQEMLDTSRYHDV